MKKVDGVRVYEFSKDSLKKRLLKTLTVAEGSSEPMAGGSAWTLRLEGGAKFSPEEFLREAFLQPEPGDWVRTRMFAEWLTRESLIAPQASLSA
jgi:hypothetical protein